MARFPLGGQTSDYDSKKSRGTLINLIAEGETETGYKSVRRTEGLTTYVAIENNPIRSNLLVNAGFIYVVAGSRLYRVNAAKAFTNLGEIGGSGRAIIQANSVPGDSQILVLNGSGGGYIYTNAGGLVQIIDADFFPSTSATVLNERFWLVRDGTNEFFGSDVSDGTSYNPLTFASSEESPDNAVAVVQKKSALWVLNTDTTEYWQSFNDPTLPLRQVKGTTKEWGIIAKDSLAEINDSFAFLADDRTVMLVQGTQMDRISDLAFDLKIKGNGTLTNPGFTTVSDAVGFFVDGPTHSVYYLTFPTEGWTWGYDVNTGMSHIRESGTLGYWRVNSAVKLGTKIICGDSEVGTLWELDADNRTENSAILKTTLISSFVSFEKDVTIPLMEIDMEVAQFTDATISPEMMVYATKDGGNTYVNMGRISLGGFGNHRARVPIRRFGRVVRNKDFGIKLVVTDAVGVQYYGAYFYPEESI